MGKSQVIVSATDIFQASSLTKIDSSSATVYPVCVWQLELSVTRMSGAFFFFFDRSSRNLKSVLLHNGKKFLLLTHSVHSNEEYSSDKTLFEALKYG